MITAAEKNRKKPKNNKQVHRIWLYAVDLLHHQKALAKSSGIVDNTGEEMRLSISWA